MSGVADENKKWDLVKSPTYSEVSKSRDEEGKSGVASSKLEDWWKSRFCGRYQADTAVKPKESNQKEEHTDTAFFRLADLSLRQELFLI